VVFPAIYFIWRSLRLRKSGLFARETEVESGPEAA
jgi:hypothetical protein